MGIIINVILWVAYVLSLYFSVFFLLVYIDKRTEFKQEQSTTILSQTPIVSIIVPALNEEKTILKTLQSINNIDYPKEKLDVIVINDGSTDQTKEVVTAFIHNKPHFRLISHANMGKGASMNKALKVSRGEYFACLDADSFVEPSTLRKMLALYEKENNPNLAIITPAMKVDNPKNILQRVQWLEYLIIIFIARLASHLDSLYVAPGPFSLYRTSIIKKLGGFDPQNITEDQEIAYRVQEHNYQIKQCFDGYVYTTAPHKIKPFYSQRRRWYLGGMICLHQYRRMIANKKYGDFGLIQLIKNTAGYILALTGLLAAVYFLALPALDGLKNLSIVRFNLSPYIQTLDTTITPLELLLTDFKPFFIVIFLFVIGFYFFYRAHKNANERMMRFGWLPLIPYFAFYYLLKGSIFLLSLVEFSRNRKIKW